MNNRLRMGQDTARICQDTAHTRRPSRARIGLRGACPLLPRGPLQSGGKPDTASVAARGSAAVTAAARWSSKCGHLPAEATPTVTPPLCTRTRYFAAPPSRYFAAPPSRYFAAPLSRHLAASLFRHPAVSPFLEHSSVCFESNRN
ncbi:hypothetical protein C8Q77DRAFT_796638 [Trametes polyzona]|nr:hypothetical protein C8Q77DRAFT_796638 [Trametes polyzona]